MSAERRKGYGMSAAAGAVAAAIGMVVCAGWMTGATRLVEWRAGLGVMMFQTAFCAALLGSGLMLASIGWRKTAAALGTVAAAFGAVILIAYLAGRGETVATAMMWERPGGLTGDPRVGPNSALGILVLGLGLAGHWLPRATKRAAFAVLAGSVGLALGAVAVTGYALGLREAYMWRTWSAMSAQAAGLMLLLGGGFLSLAWQEHKRAGNAWPPWLSIPAGAVALIVTMGLWQALAAREARNIRDQVDLNLAVVSEGIENRLRMEAAVLGHFADDFGDPGTTPPPAGAKFEVELPTASGVKHETVEWRDSGWAKVLAAVLSEGGVREQASVEELKQRTRIAVIGLEQARKAGIQGVEKESLAISVPVRRGEQMLGFLLVSHSANDLMRQALQPSRAAEGYAIRVYEGQRVVFERETGTEEGGTWRTGETLLVHGLRLRVELEPGKEKLAKMESALGPVAFVVGILLTGLVTGLVAMGQRAHLRARETEQVNLQLEAEIDHREQKETELRHANALLGGLFEKAPATILLVKTSGEIERASAETETMFGYRREELRKCVADMLIPGLTRTEEFRRCVEPSVNGNKQKGGTALDLAGKRREGSPLALDVLLVPLEVGEERRVIAVARDISERKQMERELEKKNEDLETLLHVTSHDLKEPLRAIESFSSLVAERYGAQLDEKGKDYLMRTSRAARRLDRLLSDISSLARARRMDPPAQEVSGNKLVEEALKRLDGIVQHLKARIKVAEEFPALRVNEFWATQAVYNLVANALKFVRPGEPPEIEIAPYQKNGAPVGIVVRDRGPGVNAEEARRIFQLFQRGVGREVEGTGAGLAIVRQVALRHGGEAWVESREGGGSEFIVTFGNSQGKGEKTYAARALAYPAGRG